MRIEGAPAMIEVTQLQKALGLALAFTRKIPCLQVFALSAFRGEGARAERN